MPPRRCSDCPRHCGAVRPAGFCASPETPVVARAGLHHWEEPVISGTRGSGAVFFSGCNLHCVFCQNYAISSRGEGRPITVERLRSIYRELAAQGAHNLNLVTPGHWAAAILESLDPAPPLPVVWNSNGYDSVATLRQLAGKVRIYLPDLKYADNALAARYSGAADYFEVATAAIEEMFRQTGPFRMGPDGVLESGVLIRHLMLPGAVANSLAVIDWVARRFAPGDVMFSLMRQYLPQGRVLDGAFPELNRRVLPREYRRIEDHLFRSSITDGFVQKSDAADAGFIPVFDGSGV